MPIITDNVELAAAQLKAGGLVAMPTETVYGLAADAGNPAAIARVYALKGRPASNPLIVHLGLPEWIRHWAAALSPAAERLMAAFWPGPLTLVLEAAPGVPDIITSGQPTVAIRQPDHPLALSLLQHFGGALVAPSANRYMALSPTTPEHVAAQFPQSDLLILDGGNCRVGLESTIVSVLPGQAPELLRPGMIDQSALESALEQVLVNPAAPAIRVPGQHRKHYAPSTRTTRFETAPASAASNADFGWLFCGAPFPVQGPAIDLGNDPKTYARGLYAALYDLDQMGLKEIWVQLPPEALAWRAVSDRLVRASNRIND